MSKKLRAFTLIELLIVVAIIAILAAIAVPNFLEAQVRSKVSRVKADMRSVATAIEAYAIDYNKYPIHNDAFAVGGNSDPLDQTGGNPPIDHIRVPSVITTPIAYITSVPFDPFIVANTDYPQFQPKDLFNRITYWSIQWYQEAAPTSTLRKNVLNNAGGWLMYSWGPDKTLALSVFNWGPGVDSQPPYDPTNGTVSLGNIYRSQKYSDTVPLIDTRL